MAVLNLSEKKIRDLPLGSGIYRDEQAKGLMVICHKTTKSYAVQGDVRRNGRHIRTVRIKIDRVDRIGLHEARRKSKALMSQIQGGIDPTAGPKQTGITLSDAFDAHVKERTLRPSTKNSYRDHISRYLAKFKNRAIGDINRQDVRELLERRTLRSGM